MKINKKFLNTLLLSAGLGFASLTFAPYEDQEREPSHESTNAQSAEELRENKEKLEQKQEAIKDLLENKSWKDLKKSSSQKARNDSPVYQEAQRLNKDLNLGLDLDNLKTNQLKNELTKISNNLSEQIKEAQQTTDALSKSGSSQFDENGTSDNGYSQSNTPPVSPQMQKALDLFKLNPDDLATLSKEDLTKALNDALRKNGNKIDANIADANKLLLKQVTFNESLEKVTTLLDEVITSQDNTDKEASLVQQSNELISQIFKDSGIKKIDGLTGLTFNDSDQYFDTLLNSDKVPADLKASIERVKDFFNEYKSKIEDQQAKPSSPKEEKATSVEVQKQRLALEDASSIAEDLKDFDFISEEEKANLNEKIADVKKALKDRVLSQIRAALDALKALLAELMIKVANAKGKAGSVLKEKINKLQRSFDAFIEKINSQRAKPEEPNAGEPKDEAATPATPKNS